MLEVISNNRGRTREMSDGSSAILAHDLADFDWKLKYVASSSSLDMVKKPLLRLELYLSTEPTTKREADRGMQVLIAEYNREELDDLITQMEDIQKVLGKHGSMPC